MVGQKIPRQRSQTEYRGKEGGSKEKQAATGEARGVISHDPHGKYKLVKMG